jgi:hypothetical protein
MWVIVETPAELSVAGGVLTNSENAVHETFIAQAGLGFAAR